MHKPFLFLQVHSVDIMWWLYVIYLSITCCSSRSIQRTEENVPSEAEMMNKNDILYRHFPDTIEGDIILSPVQKAVFDESGYDGLLQSQAWSANALKWGRTIPFVRDSDTLDVQVSQGIDTSIDAFHAHTCLQFEEVEETDEPHILFINNGTDYCGTKIGRPADGARVIYLANGCTGYIVAHEMMHALGRYHEQSRPDRDDYITVQPRYFDSDTTTPKQFEKLSVSDADTQGLPYDYYSVMHYDAHAFSNNEGYTIVPNDERVDVFSLGQREKLSVLDILHVNIKYCPERTVRLVGGGSEREGRVEVYWAEEWGTVSDNGFDINDGQTICKFIGYTGAEEVYGGAHFGQGSGSVWMSNMECVGNESSPYACKQSPLGPQNSTHQQDAGVKCQE